MDKWGKKGHVDRPFWDSEETHVLGAGPGDCGLGPPSDSPTPTLLTLFRLCLQEREHREP